MRVFAKSIGVHEVKWFKNKSINQSINQAPIFSTTHKFCVRWWE